MCVCALCCARVPQDVRVLEICEGAMDVLRLCAGALYACGHPLRMCTAQGALGNVCVGTLDYACGRPRKCVRASLTCLWGSYESVLGIWVSWNTRVGNRGACVQAQSGHACKHNGSVRASTNHPGSMHGDSAPQSSLTFVTCWPQARTRKCEGSLRFVPGAAGQAARQLAGCSAPGPCL